MELDLDLERVPLGEGPTPVRELTGLGSQGGGAPIWIKDDGAYSPFGGNKARKLEWLLAAARRRGAHTVITGGAIGTNHGLATALCAERLGMRTVLVLVPQPETPHVRRQLDELRRSGAELHFAPGFRRAELLGAALFLRHTRPPLGFPYPIPPGGSVPLGCVGYVEAALELAAQVHAGELPAPSHVVVALGSGGTAAGLAAGLRLAGLGTKLVCILVSDVIRLDSRKVARLARRTLALLGRHGADAGGLTVDAEEIEVETGWLGPGYGHATREADAAIELLADRDRVTLEPVYTAKAMAGLLGLNRRGAFGEGPVLYWHTYKQPTAAPTSTSCRPATGPNPTTPEPEARMSADSFSCRPATGPNPTTPEPEARMSAE